MFCYKTDFGCPCDGYHCNEKHLIGPFASKDEMYLHIQKNVPQYNQVILYELQEYGVASVLVENMKRIDIKLTD